MSIRFCEFCSTVHPEVTTHCPDCGALLVQTVSEEAFNDPNTPWPFTPIDGLCLEIQGKPRYVSFSGTHSIFHLWTELHNAYEEGCLYCRTKRNEIELARYPEGKCPPDFQLLDPVKIMEIQESKYSLYTHHPGDLDLPGLEDGLEKTYQGSFEIIDCPQRYWKDILGWLAATKPYPAPNPNWTYPIT